MARGPTVPTRKVTRDGVNQEKKSKTTLWVNRETDKRGTKRVWTKRGREERWNRDEVEG